MNIPQDRITGMITCLAKREVFVFGSNESGRHGKGAARTAMKWGAKYGQGNGIQGNTYGIPTKDASIRNTLSITKIQKYVTQFIEYAREHPDLTFYVTEIGCGLAGLSYKDVGPLFTEAKTLSNVFLPMKFWRQIMK